MHPCRAVRTDLNDTTLSPPSGPTPLPRYPVRRLFVGLTLGLLVFNLTLMGASWAWFQASTTERMAAIAALGQRSLVRYLTDLEADLQRLSQSLATPQRPTAAASPGQHLHAFAAVHPELRRLTLVETHDAAATPAGKTPALRLGRTVAHEHAGGAGAGRSLPLWYSAPGGDGRPAVRLRMDLDVAHLEALWRATELAPASAIALVRDDGDRAPWDQAAPAVPHATLFDTPLNAALQGRLANPAHADQGAWIGPLADGDTRLAVWRRVPGIAATLVVSERRTAMLLRWWQLIRWPLLALLGLMLAAALADRRLVGALQAWLAETTTLRHAIADEKQASRAKTRLLDDLGHALRTPLNGVLGHAQLLQLRTDAPRIRAHADEIFGAGHQLLTMLEQTRDLARLETGALRLACAPMALLPWCRRIVAHAVPPVPARQIVIDAAPHDDADADRLWVMADAARLRQALHALLDQAHKRAPPHGSIRIDVQARNDGRVRCSVSDGGAALPPAAREQLFEPFAHLDAAATVAGGMGLGLALARRLVEAMGGAVGVACTAAGNCYWLELPAPPATTS